MKLGRTRRQFVSSLHRPGRQPRGFQRLCNGAYYLSSLYSLIKHDVCTGGCGSHGQVNDLLDTLLIHRSYMLTEGV